MILKVELFIIEDDVWAEVSQEAKNLISALLVEAKNRLNID
jgi:hypothetical protein